MGQHTEDKDQHWSDVFSQCIPKTTNDKKVLIAIVADLIIILMYSIVLNYFYGVKNIPDMISYGLVIIPLTITCAIKYVYTFYTFNKIMILQIIAAVILIVCLSCQIGRAHV